MGEHDRLDDRRFGDPIAHMRRFELLAYIDVQTGFNRKGKAKTCNIHIREIATKFGAEPETVRSYLRWLHDHRWISYPPSKREVRSGHKGGSAHAVVSVRYQRRIGGVRVEDWLLWNQSEWLSPQHLVLQAQLVPNLRKVRKFSKRKCRHCNKEGVFPKNGACKHCRKRQERPRPKQPKRSKKRP